MSGTPEQDGSPSPRRTRPPKRLRAHLELHEGVAGDEIPSVPSHPLVPQCDATLIANQRDFDGLVGGLRDAGIFAFDTEFIGEHTYYTRTCLIQVATSEILAIIDPLAQIDMGSFWNLLVDGSVEKIVHAGTPDLELALRHAGTPPRNIFDTQIGAGFCGQPYPASLKAITQSVAGATLAPGLKFSQWDKRPLSEMQLRYAADDVRYLLLLRDALLERLEEAGNVLRMREECRRFETRAEYEPNPHARRFKAPGAGSLSHRQRHVLRRLVDWRERSASERDLSPRVFLPDEGLLTLATDLPIDALGIARAKGVPRSVKAEHGDALAAIIEHAGQERLARPSRRKPLSESQKDSIEATCEAVEAIALESRISMGLVATKREIRELAGASILGHDPGENRVLHGWRRDLLDSVLSDLGYA